jgi:monoamine oxidase
MSAAITQEPTSLKSAWARRLIRETLAAEINKINMSNGTLPIPQPGGAIHLSPDQLPPDPNFAERTAANEHLSNSNAVADITFPPRKVCIVGAGVAGLYIATILQDLNIPNLTYDILESNIRVGGRLYTHKFSEEPHDYYDIGAMRYPDIPLMDRTFALFKRTNMPLINYCLTPKSKNAACPQLFNDRLWVPDTEDPYHVSTKNGGSVPPEVVDNVDNILKDTFGPYKEALKEDFKKGYKKLMDVDDFSTREYLKRGGPEGKEPKYNFFAIQWMETQGTATNLFDQAFSESVFDSLDFDYGPKVQWYCIEGGTTKLTEAMVAGLETQVETSKRVEAISIDMDLKEDGNMSVKCAGEDKPREGYSSVFTTTSLGCLARMDLRTLELHPSQKDAIRSLHYDDSAKIALKFRYPWWIVDCGLVEGGVANTDLPLRTCVYPSYNLHDGPNKDAVLLASYTWSQDACRMGSLIDNSEKPSNEELVELILQDLARLHKDKITYKQIKDAYTGVYHAYSWTHDSHTAGAFALFGPGQFSNLYPYLTRPAAQSKFHIVGEASSAHHAWIVGALDSAYAAVHRFLYRYKMWHHLALLRRNWDKVQELETGEYGTAHLQVALGQLRKGEHVRV